MSDLTLKEMFLRFADATGFLRLMPVEDLERGLTGLEAEMLRLAADVHVAEQQGVPLHQAVNDSANFGNLNKFHVGLKDILTMELPPPLLEWARGLLQKPEAFDGDEIQLALGRIAASASHPPIHRCLARLILFECLRFAMLLLDHLPQASANLLPAVAGRPDSEAFGMDGIMAGLEGRLTAAQKLDELADAEVCWWLRRVADFKGECRPVTVMLASALVQVMHHANDLRDALGRFDEEVVAELRRRDELERILKRMNAADAVLIRNAVGPELGEQRLSVELLQANHEMVLGGRTRNALDQHFDRLKRRISDGDLAERKRPALVDLIAEQMTKETP